MQGDKMDFYKKIIKNKETRFKILGLLKFVPDKTMVKIHYFIKFGRKLNLKTPSRYTEKVQWYKLFYRDPLMKNCADKFLVREYVKEKGFENILNELYEVFEKPEDISFENLPKKFILKLSNGSSTNFICDDKNSTDITCVKDKFKKFISQSESKVGREWVYYAIDKPVIIAERLLEDKTELNGQLRDYKILCFNGKVEYIICVAGRHTPEYCHVVYDANWNKQDVIIGNSSAEANYDKPCGFDDMKMIAERLSEDFPAARVDLYNIEGKIYFGEITFFPWSGYQNFYPDQFDYVLGEKFLLPKKNN